MAHKKFDYKYIVSWDFLFKLKYTWIFKTSERNLKKAQDKCEAYESEVTEAENKMREMKAQREALVEDGEKIKNKLQELEQRQEEISENLKVVKEKLKKYEEEETKHKSEKIEFDEATEKFTTGKRA